MPTVWRQAPATGARHSAKITQQLGGHASHHRSSAELHDMLFQFCVSPTLHHRELTVEIRIGTHVSKSVHLCSVVQVCGLARLTSASVQLSAGSVHTSRLVPESEKEHFQGASTDGVRVSSVRTDDMTLDIRVETVS